MTIAYLAIDESFTVVTKSDVPEQSILGVMRVAALVSERGPRLVSPRISLR